VVVLGDFAAVTLIWPRAWYGHGLVLPPLGRASREAGFMATDVPV
jgi:hypothetical protein